MIDRLNNKYKFILILFIGIAFSKDIQAQTIAFSQNFDGTFTTIGSVSGSTVTIPSGASANIPSSQVWTGTGSNSTSNTVWHRGDYSNGWTTNYDVCSGTFGPPSCGANGTNYSALFDGFDVQAGYTGSIQSPVFDLSSYCTASLSFYYFDYDETNILVQFYNGATLAGTTTLTTQSSSWQSTSLSIPSACLTSSCSIKFTATSAYAYYPLGLDEIAVTAYSASTPTTQPTALTFGDILSTSVTGSFTDASPVPYGYLVVRTTTSTAPGNPVNGTTYTAGTTALGGVIVSSASGTNTFTASGLTPGTKYWFWVYAMSVCPNYYTSSPLSNTCTALSAKNWNGAGVSGGTGGTDFNTGANWLPTTTPGSGDEAIITTTSSANITLSANATVGALTVLNNATGSYTLVLDVQTNALTVKGPLSENINVSAGNKTLLSTRVGNSPGNITVLGNAYIGTYANYSSYIEIIASGMAASVSGTVTFKENTTFGVTYFPANANAYIGAFIWDGVGAQTITTNNFVDIYLSGACQIGNANTPTVTLLNLNNNNGIQQLTGNLTVSTGAALDLTSNYWNNYNTTGTLTVNGTLRLAGHNGGQNGSNFPKGFTGATSLLATNSTVEYYASGGVNQTIYAIPAYGNLMLTNGSVSGSTTKTAGAALTINGNTTINPLATFAASSYTHSIAGNFSNNGIFSGSSSTINFNGATLQTIGGTTATTFNNLSTSNSSGTSSSKGISIGTTATVTGALTCSNGVFHTSASNYLILANTATTSGANNTSYVDGPIQKTGNTAFTFPVGTSGNYQPISIGVPANTTDAFTAQYFHSNVYAVSSYTSNTWGATINHLSGNEYWILNRTAGTSSVAVTIGWNASSGSITNLAQLTVAKYDATLNAWKDVGNASVTGTTAAGTITSNVVGSFSPFTLGSISAASNPLPIELTKFTAVPNGNKVDLAWETATETNNAYFTIEKSKDGISFTKLIDMPAAGNSIHTTYYAETDYQPYTGTSYYRLKQTDNNGNYKYYPMVSVNFSTLQSIYIYPNPIGNASNITVEVTGYQNQEVVVVLRDMQGREFLSKVLLSADNYQAFIVDETKSLTPGTYIVTAASNDKIYNYKLIVK